MNYQPMAAVDIAVQKIAIFPISQSELELNSALVTALPYMWNI